MRTEFRGPLSGLRNNQVQSYPTVCDREGCFIRFLFIDLIMFEGIWSVDVNCYFLCWVLQRKEFPIFYIMVECIHLSPWCVNLKELECIRKSVHFQKYLLICWVWTMAWFDRRFDLKVRVEHPTLNLLFFQVSLTDEFYKISSATLLAFHTLQLTWKCWKLSLNAFLCWDARLCWNSHNTGSCLLLPALLCGQKPVTASVERTGREIGKEKWEPVKS